MVCNIENELKHVKGRLKLTYNGTTYLTELRGEEWANEGEN